MITGLIIGAGAGLTVGAGLGFLIAALLANARVAEANERADGYLAELDALTESTRPAGDLDALVDATQPPESWAAAGLRAAGVGMWARIQEDVNREREHPAAEPWRPGFDANPTVLLGPGETYEQWYAAYAERLDSWCPGWWDDLPKTVAPTLRRLAEERRAETYEQNELAEDRIPTRAGFDAREVRRHLFGMAIYPPKEGK